MKKIIGLFVALILLSLSCKELDQYTMFDFQFNFTFALPPIPEAHVPIEITLPSIPIKADSIFNHYNTSPGFIEEIVLTGMQLEITSPDYPNFAFLNRLSFWLTDKTLQDKEMAWKFPIPKEGNDTLKLETTPDNLMGYLITDTLHLKLVTINDSITHNTIMITTRMIFHVDAKILGV